MPCVTITKLALENNPNDLVAVVLSDKTKNKFGIIRLLVDAVFALVGFALGGVIGAGSIVCIALVGPVAGVFLPINDRIVQRLVGYIVSDR